MFKAQQEDSGARKEPDHKRAYELRLEIRIVFYVWWETIDVFEQESVMFWFTFFKDLSAPAVWWIHR